MTPIQQLFKYVYEIIDEIRFTDHNIHFTHSYEFLQNCDFIMPISICPDSYINTGIDPMTKFLLIRILCHDVVSIILDYLATPFTVQIIVNGRIMFTDEIYSFPYTNFPAEFIPLTLAYFSRFTLKVIPYEGSKQHKFILKSKICMLSERILNKFIMTNGVYIKKYKLLVVAGAAVVYESLLKRLTRTL